ncbi:hypothetical protein ACKC9G_00195 [Pokkaliibacter sp. CJK22405]|uniref:hypothetical protein n=1 Tax=Pokkaliibacter sp. CJK22405 TaxID=3384615 RepID=UPI0039849EFC
MKRIFVTCLFAGVLICQSASAVTQEFGWLDGACLASKNDHLSAGTALQVHDLDTDAIFSAQISDSKADQNSCNGLIPDRAAVNRDSGWHFYPVMTDHDITLAIAEIGNSTTESASWSAGYCSTSEGIHFSVTERDQKLWEGDYYLGYDIEATCASK